MMAYSALFDITVEHSFFNGACPCLDFVPTDKTRRTLNNTGLLVKKSTSGILVVYDHSRLEAIQLFLADEAEGLEFEFKVYATDPDFKTYTEPFSKTGTKVLYFSSRSSDIATGGVIRLHESEYVSQGSFIGMDSAQLKDILNKRDRLIPPMCVVRIHAAGKPSCLFDEEFNAKVPSFYLNFDSRRTYWKYYLHSDKAEDGAYVFDLDDRIGFEPTGPAELSDGRTVLTYRSKQSIPLNRNYDFRFQLKQRSNGGEKILFRQLPFASVSQTGKELVAEQAIVVSEIYINC
jgi:hypothetical protein